jgi:hypothetical protein
VRVKWLISYLRAFLNFVRFGASQMAYLLFATFFKFCEICGDKITYLLFASFFKFLRFGECQDYFLALT